MTRPKPLFHKLLLQFWARVCREREGKLEMTQNENDHCPHSLRKWVSNLSVFKDPHHFNLKQGSPNFIP